MVGWSGVGGDAKGMGISHIRASSARNRLPMCLCHPTSSTTYEPSSSPLLSERVRVSACSAFACKFSEGMGARPRDACTVGG